MPFDTEDCVLTQPSHFTVIENSHDEMMLKLVDGIPGNFTKRKGVECYSVTKTSLFGIHSRRTFVHNGVSIGVADPPLCKLHDAKSILASTTVGAFLVEVVNNKNNGIWWKLCCEVSNDDGGYKREWYNFIIVGHDGDTVQLRFLPLLDAAPFALLNYFMHEDGTHEHLINVEFGSILRYVHDAKRERLQ